MTCDVYTCSVLVVLVHRRASVAHEVRSMAPKAPRPQSGLGTRRCFFNEECPDSTAGAI